ncbi:T9SS type A sorting domain-containing protein [Subsaxibacter sp. CAU 1640]|uniref:T9SS type A sorting domain-containing protein n=1 Tax=Subsaxibacter sp. CAU 1640 TaxID=2933271 RepID=UPI002004CA4C|nr:T9SS type A sorting domain-containing protein [Subsaxibacter sp. CAU 1640]MCK7590314.1 T9SS type A sorting domain-containing protein [Subsaxibacter sp. CAU 1640]
MKKITSENLSERLVKYGAFSAAILGAANASGQIVYTDIADITVDATNPRAAIDIDVDGTGDYLFGSRTTAPNFVFMFPASASTAASYNSNAMVGFASSGFYYPSNLAAGDPINNTNGIFSSARGDFNYNACAYPGSQFCDGMDGYVGLHFKIGANTHYGWVRVQVAANASNVIIKDFAYNTTPGQSINAGQTTLSVDEFNVNDIRVVALNKNISLFNLPQSTSYNLFSTSGQSVLKGVTNNDTYVIEAASVATGVYVLELNDTATNAVIRKKVVL